MEEFFGLDQLDPVLPLLNQLTVFCRDRFYSRQLQKPELTNIRDAVLRFLKDGGQLPRGVLINQIKETLGPNTADKLINEVLGHVTIGTDNIQLK